MSLDLQKQTIWDNDGLITTNYWLIADDETMMVSPETLKEMGTLLPEYIKEMEESRL